MMKKIMKNSRKRICRLEPNLSPPPNSDPESNWGGSTDRYGLKAVIEDNNRWDFSVIPIPDYSYFERIIASKNESLRNFYLFSHAPSMLDDCDCIGVSGFAQEGVYSEEFIATLKREVGEIFDTLPVLVIDANVTVEVEVADYLFKHGELPEELIYSRRFSMIIPRTYLEYDDLILDQEGKSAWLSEEYPELISLDYPRLCLSERLWTYLGSQYPSQLDMQMTDPAWTFRTIMRWRSSD